MNAKRGPVCFYYYYYYYYYYYSPKGEGRFFLENRSSSSSSSVVVVVKPSQNSQTTCPHGTLYSNDSRVLDLRFLKKYSRDPCFSFFFLCRRSNREKKCMFRRHSIRWVLLICGIRPCGTSLLLKFGDHIMDSQCHVSILFG